MTGHGRVQTWLNVKTGSVGNATDTPHSDRCIHQWGPTVRADISDCIILSFEFSHEDWPLFIHFYFEESTHWREEKNGICVQTWNQFQWDDNVTDNNRTCLLECLLPFQQRWLQKKKEKTRVLVTECEFGTEFARKLTRRFRILGMIVDDVVKNFLFT